MTFTLPPRTQIELVVPKLGAGDASRCQGMTSETPVSKMG